MSRSLNRAQLIGNVGADPDVRVTSSGTRIAKVSLATNRTWKDRNGGRQEATEWHRLTFFGRLAEIIEKWVTKGDRLFVEGRIHYSETTDDSGITRYWTEIVVDELIMLGSYAASGDGDPRGASEERKQRAGGGRRPTRSPVPPAGPDEPDDDLPF